MLLDLVDADHAPSLCSIAMTREMINSLKLSTRSSVNKGRGRLTSEWLGKHLYGIPPVRFALHGIRLNGLIFRW
jgi:hypothetical protein